MSFIGYIKCLFQHCYCAQTYGTCGFCEGEKKLPKLVGPNKTAHPLPGDWVVMKNSNDTLIKDGNLGCIGGAVGQRRNTYFVVFNVCPTPFRDDKYVSSSGGPAFDIKVGALKRTDQVQDRVFWRWIDSPRADGGRNYTAKCRIWEFDYSDK